MHSTRARVKLPSTAELRGPESGLAFTGPLTGMVTEGSDVGTLVMTFGVNGNRGKAVSYSIVDNPSDLFELDTLTGELRTAGLFDRESLDPSGFLHIKIRASTTEGQTVDQVFTVVVQDVNDETPRFSQNEYFALVHENLSSGTPLNGLNIMAIDRDSVRST